MAIVTYILALQTEVSPSNDYRINTIFKLKQLAEFHNPKSFKDMTRQDIIDFLDSFRKAESVDPYHKWIGTYEANRIVVMRFFRWLYYRHITPHKKRPKPAVVDNIPMIPRREITTYKPTDLWTEEDDALFYKYVTSLRDKCWHAVSRDTGCRPSELLKLKIKDVVIQQLESGHHIARITVVGKTGARNVRLNNAYPRLKDWLTNGHPYAANPNAYLFCGKGTKNNGRRIATSNTIYVAYDDYKKVVFPELLQDPLVPEEDKRRIKDLIKKPWNPYIRRHTAATEISKALHGDAARIDKYMGWVHTGNTRVKYQHYYNDDGLEGVLTEMDGLVLPGSKGDKKGKSPLKPKQCPNCDESNKPESKFCAKCKFVLSFDSFNEAIQEKENAKQEIEQMKLQHELDIQELKEDVQEALKLSRKLVITDNDWLHHREEEEVEQRRRQEELQEYRQMKREKLMQQLQQQQQQQEP